MTDDKNKQPDTPAATEKKDTELSDEELDSAAGGVPGWWDYNDPTTHM